MTAPEFTDEQIEAARQYESAVREQATTLLDSAVVAFTDDPYNLTEFDAVEEIALQALTRSILLFGMLPPETQDLLKDAPLIVSPQD